jgi:hypothetical protein
MSEGGDFVFTVSKTPKSMTLKIHSPALRAMVFSALSQCPEKISYDSGDLNAFILGFESGKHRKLDGTVCSSGNLWLINFDGNGVRAILIQKAELPP